MLNLKLWQAMKLWQKILTGLLGISAALLLYWGVMRTKRMVREEIVKHKAVAAQKRAVAAAAAAAAAARAPKISKAPDAILVSKDPDDHVVLKAEHPSSLQDEKNLKGRPLWVSAGGQMEYYAFNGRSVEFVHPAGVLLGAEKIVVKDAVEVTAPKSLKSRFPDADAEVLLVFARPGDARNPGREYAVAVGEREGREYSLLTDQLFFYDDPHQLYAYWGPKVWRAIDTHTAALGMSPRQLQMALGQVSTPRADIMGDELVEYDDQGKPKLVTFEKGKAIAIRDESQ